MIPHVKPFLRENLIRLNDKAAIHECLVQPIPRVAWDLVYGYRYPEDLLRELRSRRTLNQLGGGSNAFFSTEPTIKYSSSKASGLDIVMRKLCNCVDEGEEDSLDEKILAFEPILTKKVFTKE